MQNLYEVTLRVDTSFIGHDGERHVLKDVVWLPCKAETPIAAEKIIKRTYRNKGVRTRILAIRLVRKGV